jgi:septal ring factor EnvC (AmiA/AmiB activator)
MRNPGMLGSYSVQGIELAMHCLFYSHWIIFSAMSAIAFDTLKFAKRLKEAGFTEQQAEALADAEAEFIEQNLATKRDIADIKRDIADVKRDIKELEVTLRNEIKQLDVTLRGEIKQLDVKIEQIRSDLARDLKDLEYRMTIKLGTMMVVAVAAMATLVKLL